MLIYSSKREDLVVLKIIFFCGKGESKFGEVKSLSFFGSLFSVSIKTLSLFFSLFLLFVFLFHVSS